MTTQLKDLMSLADNYAQECVYLECENQERRGIVDGSSVAVAYEARQRLEDELRRLHAENEALRADAERYRWMKQEVKRIPFGWEMIGWDAAIDAARSKT